MKLSHWMPTICTLEQEPAIENTNYGTTANKTKTSDLAVPPGAGTQSSSAGKLRARNSPADPAEQRLPATAMGHHGLLGNQRTTSPASEGQLTAPDVPAFQSPPSWP